MSLTVNVCLGVAGGRRSESGKVGAYVFGQDRSMLNIHPFSFSFIAANRGHILHNGNAVGLVGLYEVLTVPVPNKMYLLEKLPH